jgi:hypothetical protein
VPLLAVAQRKTKQKGNDDQTAKGAVVSRSAPLRADKIDAHLRVEQDPEPVGDEACATEKLNIEAAFEKWERKQVIFTKTAKRESTTAHQWSNAVNFKFKFADQQGWRLNFQLAALITQEWTIFAPSIAQVTRCSRGSGVN